MFIIIIETKLCYCHISIIESILYLDFIILVANSLILMIICIRISKWIHQVIQIKYIINNGILLVPSRRG